MEAERPSPPLPDSVLPTSEAHSRGEAMPWKLPFRCPLVKKENGVTSSLPDKPIDLKNYPRMCELRRKFPVLYKVEFQLT
ncbi:Uncharacterized protein GBIM_18272 [Gryllus bimaculatus]|nr:Uncharacterized protein GBIM_18272 [Gryllus bimaculatus]